MAGVRAGKKVPVTLSVYPDIDKLFEELAHKVIEINDEKINIRRSKNDVYNRAIEFAVEHIDDWMK